MGFCCGTSNKWAVIIIAISTAFSSGQMTKQAKEREAAAAAAETVATQSIAGQPRMVGTLRVEKYGSGSRSVILVPGLGCGSWVWKQTIDDLSPKYTVYSVTLAGFDGVPASEGPILDHAISSLETLIASERLAKPILIGHSLGGHVGLRLAEEKPDLLGGLVVVDSLPLFPPPSPGETPESRSALADQLATMLAGGSDADFAKMARSNAALLVADPKGLEDVSASIARSDRKAFAQATRELILDDIRPNLAKISTPAVVLVPVQAGAPEAATKAFYAAQYATAPAISLVTIPNSRHFAMLDQPAATRDAIAAFLAKIPAR